MRMTPLKMRLEELYEDTQSIDIILDMNGVDPVEALVVLYEKGLIDMDIYTEGEEE